MKIGIITYSCAQNYGAVLQTYALYSVLKEMGHDVFVVDYIPERYQIGVEGYEDKYLEHTNFWKKNKLLMYIWKRTRYKCMKDNMKIFRDFLNKNVVLSKTYYSYEELLKETPEADLFVTGSDQVWNSDFLWGEKIDLPYYLAFSNGKKISYASSFGKTKLTNEEKPLIYNELRKYSHISVREKSGKNIVNELGLEAVDVVDPTLLYGGERFKAMAGEQTVQNPYILVFQITYDKRLVAMAQRLAKKVGKELVVIIPKMEDKLKAKKHSIVLPKVEDWIAYFANTDYVITDSFHATAFSIMFHKNFTVNMAAGYNSRLNNILDHAGIENCKLETLDFNVLLKQYEHSIDYKYAADNVKQWVNISRNWLEEAIND